MVEVLTMSTILKVNQKMSDAEWQVRCDLAACYRLFVKFGWTDLIFTHLTARVPGYEDQYLINPYGLLFEEITASNILKVDFDGKVISGDYPYNDAGHYIRYLKLVLILMFYYIVTREQVLLFPA